MVACTSTPRSPGASRNSTVPWFFTWAPGAVSQAIRRPGSSWVTTASHSTVWPAGALTTQWERVASSSSTRSMFSMNLPRLEKRRKKP